ncbi:hypothetical protein [Corynebacterium sp. 22KM0430]|uniref:hypothetical protein n=1 Tax=unclassified Corynebacterium TaxID=2624378 RepID=UPI0039AF4A3B
MVALLGNFNVSLVANAASSVETISAETVRNVAPGESIRISDGEGGTVIEADYPSPAPTLSFYSAEDEAPASTCVTWRDEKGFTQVTNECKTDVRVRVTYKGGIVNDAGCHSIEKGTRKNVGFAGYGPARRTVDKVTKC